MKTTDARKLIVELTAALICRGEGSKKAVRVAYKTLAFIDLVGEIGLCKVCHGDGMVDRQSVPPRECPLCLGSGIAQTPEQKK